MENLVRRLEIEIFQQVVDVTHFLVRVSVNVRKDPRTALILPIYNALANTWRGIEHYEDRRFPPLLQDECGKLHQICKRLRLAIEKNETRVQYMRSNPSNSRQLQLLNIGGRGTNLSRKGPRLLYVSSSRSNLSSKIRGNSQWFPPAFGIYDVQDSIRARHIAYLRYKGRFLVHKRDEKAPHPCAVLLKGCLNP